MVPRKIIHVHGIFQYKSTNQPKYGGTPMTMETSWNIHSMLRMIANSVQFQAPLGATRLPLGRTAPDGSAGWSWLGRFSAAHPAEHAQGRDGKTDSFMADVLVSKQEKGGSLRGFAKNGGD